MTFPEKIEFPTLLGERLTRDHLPCWRELFSNPEVMKTLGGVQPDGWIEANLMQHITKWDEYGFGLWLFRERETNRFVGRGGLHVVELEGEEQVEVGYALLPEFWGRGLATEIARESVALARVYLDVVELFSLTLPDNLASQRVMEKSGFTHAGEVLLRGVPQVLYRQIILGV